MASRRSGSGIEPGQQQPIQRRMYRTQTTGNFGAEPIFNSEVVPSSLGEIAPILRVANEVEPTNPRVAYLCKYLFFDVSSLRGSSFTFLIETHLRISNYTTHRYFFHLLLFFLPDFIICLLFLLYNRSFLCIRKST